MLRATMILKQQRSSKVLNQAVGRCIKLVEFNFFSDEIIRNRACYYETGQVLNKVQGLPFLQSSIIISKPPHFSNVLNAPALPNPLVNVLNLSILALKLFQ